MARSNSIRWDKATNKRLGRAIDAYNKRVKRFKASHPDQKLQIDTISRKEAKALITTKSQLNTFIKQLERANAKTLLEKKGARSEYEKYQARLKRNYVKDIVQAKQQVSPIMNEREERLREAIKNIDASETMGRFPTDEDMLKRQIGLKNLSDDNYDKLLSWIGDDKRAEQSIRWKNNYLKLIREHMEVSLVMNNKEGYAILQELYKKVSAMGLDAFIIGQLVSQAELGIGQIISSPPSNLLVSDIELDEQNGEYRRVLEAWDRYG